MNLTFFARPFCFASNSLYNEIGEHDCVAGVCNRVSAASHVYGFAHEVLKPLLRPRVPRDAPYARAADALVQRCVRRDAAQRPSMLSVSNELDALLAQHYKNE